MSLPLPINEYNTFQPFMCLPPELRTQVWHHTLTPRTVPMITQREYPEDDLQEIGRDLSFSTDSVPALLHVHRESRGEGLRLYKRLSNDFASGFFNPKMDTLRHGFLENTQAIGLPRDPLLYAQCMWWRAGDGILNLMGQYSEQFGNITSISISYMSITRPDVEKECCAIPKHFPTLRKLQFVDYNQALLKETLEDSVPSRYDMGATFRGKRVCLPHLRSCWHRGLSAVSRFTALLHNVASRSGMSCKVPEISYAASLEGEIVWEQVVDKYGPTTEFGKFVNFADLYLLAISILDMSHSEALAYEERLAIELEMS